MGRPRRTVSSALAVAGIATLAFFGLTAASRSSPQPIVYDALGDSFASGFGVPPYSACGRSAAAYAHRLDGRMRVRLDDFVACSGATTASLVAGGQLDALGSDTDLVTISIGGNDIGWSRTVGACLIGVDAQCTGSIAAARHTITTTLPALLDSVYTQIAARAPHAQVLVVGYPRLFSPEYGAFLAASPAEQRALNDGADLLDHVIAGAAARHGFRFVDVTRRFDGHGVNSTDPWLHGPLDPAAFHPTVQGYRAYAAAVIAAVVPASFT